jgi:DNA-binding MarR family transcriptional regulator
MNTIEHKRNEDSPENAEPGPSPHEALKRFRLIFRAVQQHSQRVESCCGVSCGQLWAMSELLNEPGMNVSELARTMAVHQSTVSNLLVKLTKKGLVRRERADGDQRVVRLYLTETGQTLVEQAPDPRQGLLLTALTELPPPVLISLNEGLNILVDAMHINDEQGALQPFNMSGDGSEAKSQARKPRQTEPV